MSDSPCNLLHAVSPWSRNHRLQRNLFLLLQLFWFGSLNAQNLDKIGKKDMVTVNGSMSYNTIYYNAFGMEDRRDPYAWYFNGNLNISILDVSLPFTYSYSNHNGTYTQPFNMQSCSPKYKWAQAHLGTTAMNFSDYTLAGHTFTGAGLELRPGKVFIGAMYGRLLKAVPYNMEEGSSENMSFRRMGEAVKFGFEDGEHSIGVTWFHAKDDASSLTFVPSAADLYAQENSAISLKGKAKLWKYFIVEGEFALSGITRNVEALPVTMDFSGLEKWLLHPTTTTQYFHAYKCSAGFTSKNISVIINHEHIDPDYQTFGGYYFNNDIENWTIAPALRLFKGKLSIALNGGMQRNNLDHSKESTTSRLVGSVNMSCSPEKEWMFNAAYSNFTSFTNRRPQVDPFFFYLPSDTLMFYQVSRQGTFTGTHTFGSKNLRSTIAWTSSYQVSQQKQLLNAGPQNTVMNSNLSYSMQHIPSKFTFTLMGNYNRSAVDTLLTQYTGPGVQVAHAFMKGLLKISVGSTYNRSYAQEILTSHVLSSRLQVSVSPKLKENKFGRFNFSFSAAYLDEFPVNVASNTGELTVMGNAGYGFQ